MKKWLLILSGFLPGFFSFAQPKTLQQMLKEGGIRPTKVMLVGCFHFSYPNMDKHKIAKSDMRDIFSEKSQKELDELMEVMREYQPTRIYLESDDQQNLDSAYSAFTDETLLKQANERVQIGFLEILN